MDNDRGKMVGVWLRWTEHNSGHLWHKYSVTS